MKLVETLNRPPKRKAFCLFGARRILPVCIQSHVDWHYRPNLLQLSATHGCRSGAHVQNVLPDAHFIMQVDVNKRLGLLQSELQKLKQEDNGRKAKTSSSLLPPGQEGLALER